MTCPPEPNGVIKATAWSDDIAIGCPQSEDRQLEPMMWTWIGRATPRLPKEQCMVLQNAMQCKKGKYMGPDTPTDKP
jgi:hypothetical protein